MSNLLGLYLGLVQVARLFGHLFALAVRLNADKYGLQRKTNQDPLKKVLEPALCLRVLRVSRKELTDGVTEHGVLVNQVRQPTLMALEEQVVRKARLDSGKAQTCFLG